MVPVPHRPAASAGVDRRFSLCMFALLALIPVIQLIVIGVGG
jgi:hypothetical protein